MQRRLALAAALAHQPELLFLDEPTAGIDPILRATMWEHFRTLRDGERTLVVSTQYVGEAAGCDRVAVLAEGALLLLDTPEGLRRSAFGGDVVELQTVELMNDAAVAGLRALRFVADGGVIRHDVRQARIIVSDGAEDLPRIVEWAADAGLTVASCEVHHPSYDEVFVRLVETHRRTSSPDRGVAEAAPAVR